MIEAPSSHSPVSHPATWPSDKLLEACAVKHIRGSGPGGQHRNKVSTGIHITHRASGIIGQATERRSQSENLSVAIQRLRVLLAIELRSELPLREDLQSFGATYGGARLRISQTNELYPCMLVHLLDQIGLDHGGLDEAVVLLRTSASQIVRLLREEPKALQRVNEWRAAAGRAILK